MNFWTEPTTGVTANAPMTEEQVEIAAAFIDELWHIGVFELIPDDCEMKANAPLFRLLWEGSPVLRQVDLGRTEDRDSSDETRRSDGACVRVGGQKET